MSPGMAAQTIAELDKAARPADLQTGFFRVLKYKKEPRIPRLFPCLFQIDPGS